MASSQAICELLNMTAHVGAADDSGDPLETLR
jgi:hypothetical protein